MLFNSKEIKQLLKLSDCELMHTRKAGKIFYEKYGAAYFYQLPDAEVLLNHPLADKLTDWYKDRHDIDLDNMPNDQLSKDLICDLIGHILIPIERKFGDITITYGFTSAKLNRFIQKESAQGTYPSLDQHSACERNTKGKHICERGGLACDFTVEEFENRMNKVTDFIVNNLNFDKIYYYGEDRPVHISINKICERHLQIMNLSKNGRRIPGKKAYGEDAKLLTAEL